MARIVVTNETFYEAIEDLQKSFYIGLDTETYGLNAYKGDRLFSIIMSNEENDYYFNFKTTPDHLGNLVPEEYTLPKDCVYGFFTELFNDTAKTWFIHNAKFDMHMLYQEGFELAGRVICTQMGSRLLNNRLPSYKLENIAPLIGFKKDDTLEKYITKHKLFTDIKVEGKKKPTRNKHYDLVPFEITSQYGLTDGRIHYTLGMYILKRIKELSDEQEEQGLPSLSDCFINEVQLTKVLFEMEKVGVKLDLDYCKEAYEYESNLRDEEEAKFYSYTGIEFEDSPTCFKEVFKKLGLPAGKTAKGNDSYAEENLPDNPVTKLILGWRQSNKRAGTYWRNYLDLMDKNHVIHCNYKQGGTFTGRISSSNPNLQNVPKRGEDAAKYPVRRGFIPREGYFFAMLDFDQMEYRLLLDIANEQEVIREIKENGLDVHDATANTMGVIRDQAKTLNFMLLYGGGAAKLAGELKVILSKAKQLKSLYFRSLKRVKALCDSLTTTAKTRGYIVNWLGRRLYLDKEAPYRMPNHYIQGGCGDVCKLAMVEIYHYLKANGFKTRMLMQVHDELIFEVKYGEELKVLPAIKEIMQTVYPYKNLQLTAGIDISKTDWFNKGGWNGESISVN